MSSHSTQLARLVRVRKMTIVPITATALLALTVSPFARTEDQQLDRDIDRVAVAGAMDVFIKIADKPGVRLEGPKERTDNILLETKGDQLYIGEKQKGWFGGLFSKNTEKVSVFVTVTALEAVRLSGSGNVEVGAVSGDRFDVALEGSGDITFDKLDVDKLDISLAGSGDIVAENGRCTEADIALAGSGGINVQSVACQAVEVALAGSGDIDFTAQASARVELRGSGDVRVYGDPKDFMSSVAGSGDIHKASH